jgi:ketosteroid isomerase-like protein
MHPYLFIPSIFLLANPVSGDWQANAELPMDVGETLLRVINHRMVSSRYARIDDFTIKTIADDFFAIGSDGAWLGRNDYVRSLAEKKEQVEVYYDDVRLQSFGNSGLVHAVATIVSKDATKRHVRYTDAYVRGPSGWQLVASQETELGPQSAIALNEGKAPVFKPWNGRDPEGDEIEVLRTLNASYVDSFRKADVDWYAGHLAPGYLVTFGDGSFHDRAAALTDFGVPYFEMNIASFPVDDVKIRVFGEIAIIHAENDYRLKDGRKGINRYTDIWRKSGGRWMCVSAHITVYKPPSL